MNKRLFFVFILVLSLLLNLHAQQQPGPRKIPGDQDQDVVRITTNLVQVDVVVTKDGKQVKDLTAADFEILEDGKRQTITEFSYISNLGHGPSTGSRPSTDKSAYSPSSDRSTARRTIAFVVDDLGMSYESMARMREKLRKLIDEQMTENDLVAVMRTGGGVGALQQFTTDKRRLADAISILKWNHCSRVGANVLSPTRPFDYQNPNPCAENSVDNSVNALRFIVKGMRELPGRKAMIIISDSLPTENPELFDPNSIIKTKSRTGQKLPIRNAISNSIKLEDEISSISELASRSSVVIYGIDTSGLQTTGIKAADEIFQPPQHQIKPEQEPSLLILRQQFKTLNSNREAAAMLAEATGGFLLRNTNEIQGVMEDQQGYYLIGYKPSGDTFNRTFITSTRA